MANPQKENGHIRIANELFDQFVIRDFSMKQLKIIMLILRLSYGFSKKEAFITKQYLFELSGIYKCDVAKELKHLSQNNVIIWDKDNNVFSLNKNYDQWNFPFHKLYDKENYQNLIKNQFVKHKLIETESLQNTNQDVCETQTFGFVKHKPIEAENILTEQDLTPSKNILKPCKDKIIDNIVDVEGEIPTAPAINNFIPEISDEEILQIKEEFKNFYGEYSNVYLPLDNYNRLLTLTMSQKAVDLIIADFSKNIELGKEEKHSAALPNKHYLRLIEYWKYLRKNPKKLQENNIVVAEAATTEPKKYKGVRR